MGEADGVVGNAQVLEQVELAPAPHAAVAVLVAGEVRELRYEWLAVRVGRIGCREMIVAAPDAESIVRVGAAVEHEPIEVRVRGVAAELSHFGPAWPSVLAD